MHLLRALHISTALLASFAYGQSLEVTFTPKPLAAGMGKAFILADQANSKNSIMVTRESPNVRSKDLRLFLHPVSGKASKNVPIAEDWTKDEYFACADLDDERCYIFHYKGMGDEGTAIMARAYSIPDLRPLGPSKQVAVLDYSHIKGSLRLNGSHPCTVVRNGRNEMLVQLLVEKEGKPKGIAVVLLHVDKELALITKKELSVPASIERSEVITTCLADDGGMHVLLRTSSSSVAASASEVNLAYHLLQSNGQGESKRKIELPDNLHAWTAILKVHDGKAMVAGLFTDAAKDAREPAGVYTFSTDRGTEHQRLRTDVDGHLYETELSLREDGGGYLVSRFADWKGNSNQSKHAERIILVHSFNADGHVEWSKELPRSISQTGGASFTSHVLGQDLVVLFSEPSEHLKAYQEGSTELRASKNVITIAAIFSPDGKAMFEPFSEGNRLIPMYAIGSFLGSIPEPGTSMFWMLGMDAGANGKGEQLGLIQVRSAQR